MWYVFGLIAVGVGCFIWGGALGVSAAQDILKSAIRRIDLVAMFPGYINVPMEYKIKRELRYNLEKEE